MNGDDELRMYPHDPMEAHSVRQLTTARIPTVDGEFTLSLYENTADDKDHLALIHGDIDDADDVLVRVHSECFTGDVLGSLRCDCGEQLNASMRRIASEGGGILLYLRQEGRGIGLLDKLKAYNLQDEGYDTVEANRMLGHGADERDYSIGALILKDLGVTSVRLLTNNPEKVESLEEEGITIAERVPLQPHLNPHNTEYLQTKVDRMRHLLELGPLSGGTYENPHSTDLRSLRQRAQTHYRQTGHPFVTLTFAQSLDGSIARADGHPISISGEESLSFTHELRAVHDAILVGIGTVLSDNPRLNVRRTDGSHPQPIILDTELRVPLDARVLTCDGPGPIIATNDAASDERKEALEREGATVVRLQCGEEGICLTPLLDVLGERGIESVMVEGGTRILTSFMRHRRVNHLIATVSPMFVGGTPAFYDLAAESELDEESALQFPRLNNLQYRWLESDLILRGDPVWPE